MTGLIGEVAYLGLVVVTALTVITVVRWVWGAWAMRTWRRQQHVASGLRRPPMTDQERAELVARLLTGDVAHNGQQCEVKSGGRP